MTTLQQILDTAHNKRGVDREDYLIEVIETIYAKVEPIVDGLQEDCPGMTKQQKHMLHMMVLNAGKVVSGEQLAEHAAAVLGKDTFPSTASIKVQVSRLRSVLPDTFGVIETVWGRGYRLNLAEGA